MAYTKIFQRCQGEYACDGQCDACSEWSGLSTAVHDK